MVNIWPSRTIVRYDEYSAKAERLTNEQRHSVVSTAFANTRRWPGPRCVWDRDYDLGDQGHALVLMHIAQDQLGNGHVCLLVRELAGKLILETFVSPHDPFATDGMAVLWPSEVADLLDKLVEQIRITPGICAEPPASSGGGQMIGR